MTDNFPQFSASIDRFTDEEIPRIVHDAQTKMALQADRGVVLKTPIDTGRAKANWMFGLGSPSNDVSDATDPSGRQTLAEHERAIRAAPPFSIIWLSNNLPYIRALEDGHSGQAPNGMVAVTVTELKSQFRRIE